MSEWIVLQQDRLPAYITWERYSPTSSGYSRTAHGPVSRSAPQRQSAADEPAGLWGLWQAHVRQLSEQIDRLLWVYAAEERGIDVLRSRSRGGGRSRGPAGLACFGARHLGAQPESDPGRAQGARPLHRHWKHRLERAAYEAERAERQYRAVEPENRLVTHSLERHWEQAMRNQRDLAEEYDRFLKEQPPHLSDDQRARIPGLSSDLPTLWNAPETTAADRKEIIRLVVDRVVVHVRADSECAEAVIWWRGGVTTRHEIVRPVCALQIIGPLRSVDQPDRRTAQEGRTIKQIAAQLNGEGYHTPRSRKGYTSTSVRKLLSRCELTHGRIGTRRLNRHEWWLPDLARASNASGRAAIWAIRGRVRSRQVPPRGLWVVWADGRNDATVEAHGDSRSSKSAEQTSS